MGFRRDLRGRVEADGRGNQCCCCHAIQTMKGVIIEIRAGGGDEAGLFAADLFPGL